MKTGFLRPKTRIFAMMVLMTVPAFAAAQSEPSTPQAAAAITSLQQRIEIAILETRELEKLVEGADGELREMLERRLEAKQLQIVDDINSLSEGIVKQEKAGKDLGELRKVVIDYLHRLMPAFRRVIDRERKVIVSLVSAAPAKELHEAMSREIALRNSMATLVDWYADYHASTGNLEAFGIDATNDKEYLTTRLKNLAEMLADAIGFANRKIEDSRTVIALTPDDKHLQTRMKLAELRRDMAVTNLAAVTEILEQLGVDGSEYKSLVLQVSGDVSTGILETGVWANLLQQWGQSAWSWFGENSLDWFFKIVILVVILYVARALSRIVRRIVEQAVNKLNLSMLLRRMIIATAANGVFILGILIALSQIGVSVGPLLAGLGIAGIIIGFALQDTLSNFASGMMILIYRPYDVGDLIDAGGEFGTVTDMNLVSTVILTIDNQKLVIPNNLIWRGVIRNVTAQKNRRVDMTFGISYNDDIPKAERILKEILDDHELVLDDPEPVVKLHTLGESSVDFIVRPWVKTDDYWDVYWDVTREVKMRFDAQGVSIPFPQRDVHLYGAENAQSPPGETSSTARVTSETRGSNLPQAES